MARYFTKLGALNTVLSVIVAEQEVIDSGLFGPPSSYVETFIDATQRGAYAGKGWTFNPLKNAFETTALDPALSTPITPLDARLDVSDVSSSSVVERSNIRLSMLRNINDIGANFRACAPNARLRFKTDATAVEIGVSYTKLTTHGAFNSTTEIIVDGVSTTTLNAPVDAASNSAPSVKKVTLTFGSAAMRTIELLWPYADSMDFLYLRTNAAASVVAPAPRPTAKICVIGDSITQGFNNGTPSQTWPHLLGVSKGRQVVNLGFGGRSAIPSDGLAADPTCTAIVYMIGTNDYIGQVSLSGYQSNVRQVLQNIRAAAPSARIYAVSPIFETTAFAIPMSSYRARMASAVSESGDANTQYVDGLSLMPNNANQLADGLYHPNTAGAAAIAASLAAIIQ